MGGTHSTSTSSLLNSLAVNASTSTIMQCATAATQEELVQVQNVAGNVNISNVSMNQGATINLQCVMQTNTTTDIASAVSDAITQYANSQGQAVLSALGNTTSEVKSNIQNKITSNINQTTSQQMSANITQQQGITAANIGGNVTISNITMDQSAQVFASALMNTTAFASVINSVANTIDQTSASKETTIFDSIAQALGTLLSTPIYLIGAGLLGVVAIFVIIKIAFKV